MMQLNSYDSYGWTKLQYDRSFEKFGVKLQEKKHGFFTSKRFSGPFSDGSAIVSSSEVNL